MKNIKYSITALCTFLLAAASANAVEIKVGTIAELNEAISKVKPGDRIIMSNGTWKDTAIDFNAKGASKDSIFLEAETAGKVILSGNSSLKVSGDYLVAKGLWFKDGYSKFVISFMSKDKVATNSRVTNCAITDYNPETKAESNHWVELWGKNNRFDNNYVAGKNNDGCTLVVWLKGEENHQNHHRIDHNYFGERPPLGANGGETIRIGTSHNSMFQSNTIVEWNKFEKCNGEVEIISNKSCNNTFRNNLFLESQGSMVFRHGNNCLVENNVFLGNNQPYTGGVRVINEGHTVKNNYFYGLTGQDFRGSLVIMNGVPNSPLNRYNQVKNATVTNNIFYNCSPFQLGAGKDEERSLAPITSVISDNIIYNDTDAETVAFFDDMKGITFKNNTLDTKNTKKLEGFTPKKLTWKKEGAIFVPSEKNNIDCSIFQKVIANKTGTSWNPKAPKVAIQEETINVEPGTGTLEKAVKKAKGKTKFILAAGTYLLDRSIIITDNITIQGEDAAKTTISFNPNAEKMSNYLFRAESGARLSIEKATLTAKETQAVKYAIVSPKDDTPGSYSVFINKSIISDFTNAEGGSVFKASKGTFADTIKISNSILRNNFRGINLSSEKDDTGKYNAENVILENTVFSDFSQWTLHYYRGGNDESTIGGNLVIDHCVFSRIGTTEKDLVVQNKGIVNVKIQNSVFYDNSKITNPLRLNGKNNTIKNSVIYNSGEIKLSGNAVSENIISKNPGYQDMKQFLPKDKSPLKAAGTDKKDIGILVVN
ncbi:Chondroitinase-B precursor [compost metagenome]